MKTLFAQFFDARKIARCIAFIVIPALLFYGLALATMTANGFTVLEILRDPAQVKNQSSFLGFLSNIGVGLWVSAAAISFFTVLTGDFSADRRRRELVLLTGILSFVLAIDDFFLIHDRYVNQKLCYGLYALCASALLLRHFKAIMAIEGFAFVLAGSLLAASILTDLAQPLLPLNYMGLQILEEGLKFSGAATWLYFAGRAASLHSPR